MRNLSQREVDLLQSDEYRVHYRVYFEDADGNMIDLTDYENRNWIERIEISNNIDNGSKTIKFEIQRNRHKRTFATLMKDSPFNNDGSYKNPTLANLYNKMTDLNVGVANFSSAVKTGLTRESTVEDFTEDNLIEIPMEDRGIQMEVPEHFVDSNNLFGTQIRKLIMADLVEGVDYQVLQSGETEPLNKKAADLQKMYEDIIERMYKWEPAVLNGEPIEQRYVISSHFREGENQ